MNITKLFRAISAKMMQDFNASEEVHHNVTKGTFREVALRDFFSEGRLPQRYGLGSGEVVGIARDVSGQCDVINKVTQSLKARCGDSAPEQGEN